MVKATSLTVPVLLASDLVTFIGWCPSNKWTNKFTRDNINREDKFNPDDNEDQHEFDTEQIRSQGVLLV